MARGNCSHQGFMYIKLWQEIMLRVSAAWCCDNDGLDVPAFLLTESYPDKICNWIILEILYICPIKITYEKKDSNHNRR